MRLGTPLSPSATRVMLLALANSARKSSSPATSGVEVIAVDRYPTPPAIRSPTARM